MPREFDELTLTAYALGELDDAEHAIERAELEARLASDTLMRRQVEEIRATAQWVSAELAAETTPGLSEIQHAAIERRLERAGLAAEGPIPLRPVPRNWAFWGSLAASIAIVCTVMATVLPKLYHLGSVGPRDVSSGVATPATGARPFIVESTEPPSGTSPDPGKPAIGDEPFASSNGLPQAAPPVERGENAFVRVSDSPLSSVPTLSAYPEDAGGLASIARSLDSHRIPPADSLRTDEIVNAFPYHYAAPSGDKAISANIEVAGCPWDPSHRLLRVGLRTADTAPATRPATLPSGPGGGVVGLKALIEFNPAMAGMYRLIGYETGPSAGNYRDGSTEIRPDFYLGAGRSITVLYEVIPVGMVGPSAPLATLPLKYQKLTPVADASRELATVTLRYRDGAATMPSTGSTGSTGSTSSPQASSPQASPGQAPVCVRAFSVTDAGRSFAAASEDFRVAAAAAAFGLALRDSAYKGADNYDLVIDALASAGRDGASSERAKLMEMAKEAKSIARLGLAHQHVFGAPVTPGQSAGRLRP